MELSYNPGWESNEDFIKGSLSEKEKEIIMNCKGRSILNKYYVFIPCKNFIAFFSDKSKTSSIKAKYKKHFKLSKKDKIECGFNKTDNYERF